MTEALCRPGLTYVCTIPRELGAVTKMEIKNGRVVAETESGVAFLVLAGAPIQKTG